jgi:GNAT superfamily N-acetyltransferase
LSRITLNFLDGLSDEAGELARLHAAEWRHLYTAWDGQTALEEFGAQKTDGTLPATLVLREGGQLVGSVSVVDNDCEARMDLNPWLASLYVMPGQRRRGHGGRLVAAALELARRNGVEFLHVFTESAEHIFRKHGFLPFEDAKTNGRPVTILRRQI